MMMEQNAKRSKRNQEIGLEQNPSPEKEISLVVSPTAIA